MKCANCSADAEYYIDESGANPLGFCVEHLPPHLRPRAAAGEFPLPDTKQKP